jgi:hypothetical protein
MEVINKVRAPVALLRDPLDLRVSDVGTDLYAVGIKFLSLKKSI